MGNTLQNENKQHLPINNLVDKQQFSNYCDLTTNYLVELENKLSVANNAQDIINQFKIELNSFYSIIKTQSQLNLDNQTNLLLMIEELKDENNKLNQRINSLSKQNENIYLELEDLRTLIIMNQEPKIEINQEPKIEINQEPKIEINQEPNIEINQEPKIEINQEPKIEINQEPNIEINQEIDNESPPWNENDLGDDEDELLNEKINKNTYKKYWWDLYEMKNLENQNNDMIGFIDSKYLEHTI